MGYAMVLMKTTILVCLILTARWSHIPLCSATEVSHDRIDVESSIGKQLSQVITGENSLCVDIKNNMAGLTSFDLDCNAYSSYRQLLTDLGPGPVKPNHSIIYYMNLLVLTPGIVTCNVGWMGRNKTITVYDNNNMELGYLYIQWSIDERGFSLYNTVSNIYQLYKAW